MGETRELTTDEHWETLSVLEQDKFTQHAGWLISRGYTMYDVEVVSLAKRIAKTKAQMPPK